MLSSPPTPPAEEQKSYETIRVVDGEIDAAPVDTPWYCGLIFERVGPDRGNVDHWIVHLTLGNTTTHMPMKVFLTLKKILSDVKQ